jgi:hypothetical protein
MDPASAEGFGDLSVHEVATDPTDPDVAYLSYHSGALRAIQIVGRRAQAHESCWSESDDWAVTEQVPGASESRCQGKQRHGKQ